MLHFKVCINYGPFKQYLALGKWVHCGNSIVLFLTSTYSAFPDRLRCPFVWRTSEEEGNFPLCGKSLQIFLNWQLWNICQWRSFHASIGNFVLSDALINLAKTPCNNFAVSVSDFDGWFFARQLLNRLSSSSVSEKNKRRNSIPEHPLLTSIYLSFPFFSWHDKFFFNWQSDKYRDIVFACAPLQWQQIKWRIYIKVKAPSTHSSLQ